MAKPRLCKLCRERPAEVPDRENESLVYCKLICRECHAQRLAEDMKVIAQRASVILNPIPLPYRKAE